MKNVNKYKKFFNSIILIFLLVLITGCTAKDQDKKEEVKVEEPNIVVEDNISFDTFEEYISYIKDIEGFEPYYNMVFTFEKLTDGVSSIPSEKVISMYQDLKKKFNYRLVSINPLEYSGLYTGDPKFIDLPSSPAKSQLPENEITAIKSIWIGETFSPYFDDKIEEGRNFQSEDFILKSSTDYIPVVLGNLYKGIYDINDEFSMGLIGKDMNFKVIGFYKPNISFSMVLPSIIDVDIDYMISIPHYIPTYKANGEDEEFQQAFLIGELMSGYLGISDPIEAINDDIYDSYLDKMDILAKKHDVENLYNIAFWPIGFVLK